MQSVPQKATIFLFAPSKITILRCNVLNPATLLPLHDKGDGQSPGHDCEQEVEIFYTPPNPVLDDPIPNAEVTLYVDGSRLQKPEGGFAAGFAVADDTSVLYSETLDPGIHSAKVQSCLP